MLFKVCAIFIIMLLPVVVLVLMFAERQVGHVWYVLALTMARGNKTVNRVMYAWSVERFCEGYLKLLGLLRFHARINHTFDRFEQLAVRFNSKTTNPTSATALTGSYCRYSIKVMLIHSS